MSVLKDERGGGGTAIISIPQFAGFTSWSPMVRIAIICHNDFEKEKTMNLWTVNFLWTHPPHPTFHPTHTRSPHPQPATLPPPTLPPELLTFTFSVPPQPPVSTTHLDPSHLPSPTSPVRIRRPWTGIDVGAAVPFFFRTPCHGVSWEKGSKSGLATKSSLCFFFFVL